MSPPALPTLPERTALVYEELKKIRASKTCALRPIERLRTEIRDLSGHTVPFRLRYYQVQGIYHLLMMKRLILGDGTGLGKTVEMLGALCYLWQKEPLNKVLIVAPKSAIRQWAGEIERFARDVRVYVVSGKLEERRATWEAWVAHPADSPTKAVLIINYALLIRDWDHGAQLQVGRDGKPDPKLPMTPGLLDSLTAGVKDLVVIYDEATAFKNTQTKTWQTCRFLSDRAHRCYGLTATLLKNNLIEGFAIYKVICPSVFGNKTSFMNEYCVTKMQPVGGGRKVPIVVGYRNLQHFRDRIDPYFLGRPKHIVSDELPTLITKEVLCELSLAEDAKYTEALTGVLELGDGEVRDFEEHKAFVSLIYCQQVCDSISLLRYEGGDEIVAGIFKDEGIRVKDMGAKEQTLLDLLADELDGEKVIVYTRFASLVPRLQAILAEQKIKSVAITGQVQDTAKNPARRKAQEAFQNLESDVRVIFITDAGSEAINLQAASAMIFYDAPWSFGNYVQLLGRPIRIGSPHQHVVVYHLIAERPREKKKDRKTIDHHTLDMLGAKKDLIDKVLGESAVGALEFEKQSPTKELVRKLQGKESS